MPSFLLFHRHYWEFSDSNAAPVHKGLIGYPSWQASVIAPSLLGALGAWIDHKIAQWRWWRAVKRRIVTLDREQAAVLFMTLDALESPAYPRAQQAVRGTARTLGFTNPAAWKDLSRHIKADAGRTENMYRHQEAMRLLREGPGSTLTNPQQNFVTELAYQGFTVTRK